MSKVTRFEDLRCWQLARELVHNVYATAEAGKLARDFETKDQIKSASLSVMNNIAEGFGRFSNKELSGFWISFKAHALKLKVLRTFWKT